MTLKLVGHQDRETCGTCQGRGSIMQPDTVCVRSGMNGDNGRGGEVLIKGGRVPCPTCLGRKSVPAGEKT